MEETNIKQKHEQMLWVTVRIAAANAWGSGTVIYSGKTDPSDKDSDFVTYVVTCHHVIADNIIIDEKFDPKVGYEVKKETRTPVEVQLFYYDKLSICQGVSGSQKADIVAYDTDADLALLKLRGNRLVEFVANLFPKDKVDEIHIFDPVWACGAALAHEPIATNGIINFLNETIESGVDYWMSSAQIIFGNSGGSMYRYSEERKRYELIGVPARVAISMTGFSSSPVSHMGFFVPITRIYRMLDENYYQFIYDSKYTAKKCEELRKAFKEKQEKLFLSRFGGKPEQQDENGPIVRPHKPD